MTVYILSGVKTYYFSNPLGVYSSYELAEKAKDEYVKKQEFNYFEIAATELDCQPQYLTTTLHKD